MAAGATRPADAAALYTERSDHHLVADHKMSLALGSVLAKELGRTGRDPRRRGKR